MTLSFPKMLPQITNLVRAIKEAEEKKQRVCYTASSFQIFSSTQAVAQNSLGEAIEKMNQLLKATLEASQENRISWTNTSQSDLITLETRLVQIEDWVHKSVANYDCRWKFLHLIPFSNWRQKWLNQQSKIHSPHHQMRSTLEAIRAQMASTQMKLASDSLDTLMESIEGDKKKFIEIIKNSANAIEALVQQKTNKPTQQQLTDLMKGIVSELKKMTDAAEAVKKCADNCAKKMSYRTTDNKTYLQENYFEVTVDDQKQKAQDRLAKSYLKVTADQNQKAKIAIEDVIIEIEKLTESTIHFLELSLPDQTSIFFTPIADPEKTSTEHERTLSECIEEQLEEANLLIKHCHKLLKEQTDLNAKSPPQQGGITLAYASTQAIRDRVFEIIKQADQKMARRSRESVEQKKTSQQAQDSLKIHEKKMKWLVFHSRFNLFLFLIKRKSDELKRQMEEAGEAIKKIKNKIILNKDIDLKFEREEKYYGAAQKKWDEFLKEFGHLSETLQQKQILDLHNQPVGEVLLELTNPVMSPGFRMPTHELSALADLYRGYIHDLIKLKEMTAKASVAFSQLQSLILFSSGSGEPPFETEVPFDFRRAYRK